VNRRIADVVGWLRTFASTGATTHQPAAGSGRPAERNAAVTNLSHNCHRGVLVNSARIINLMRLGIGLAVQTLLKVYF
jgi:hypothetical protein